MCTWLQFSCFRRVYLYHPLLCDCRPCSASFVEQGTAGLYKIGSWDTANKTSFIISDSLVFHPLRGQCSWTLREGSNWLGLRQQIHQSQLKWINFGEKFCFFKLLLVSPWPLRAFQTDWFYNWHNPWSNRNCFWRNRNKTEGSDFRVNGRFVWKRKHVYWLIRWPDAQQNASASPLYPVSRHLGMNCDVGCVLTFGHEVFFMILALYLLSICWSCVVISL